MEPVTALIHRYVMHVVGWAWHKSHHERIGQPFELNDLFPVVFSVLAIALFVLGMSNDSFTDQEFLINSVLALNAKAIVFGTSTVNIYKPEYIQRAMELLKSTREGFHNRYRIYRSSSDVTDIAMILGLDDLAIEVAFEILNVRNKIEIPWKSAIETPERPLAFEL